MKKTYEYHPIFHCEVCDERIPEQNAECKRCVEMREKMTPEVWEYVKAMIEKAVETHATKNPWPDDY